MFSLRLQPVFLAAVVFAAGGCGTGVADESHSFAWPPKLDEPYPDLVLQDYQGERVELSSFRGKVLLIEPIGMT